MNLGKLLGAGKSFISGGKPAAYREDKRFYLPQFVSPKNPFANPAVAGAGRIAESAGAGKPWRRSRKPLPPWAKTQKIAGSCSPRGHGAGDHLGRAS